MASMSTNWRAGQRWQDSSSGSRSETDDRQQDEFGRDSQTVRPAQGDADDKIAAGMRIYLGNLLYHVKPDEIDDMLAANGFREDVDSVHISIDAVSGRNPGYCFIDFKNPESARSALETLAGNTIRGRPVKVGPCKPKGAERAWKDPNYTPTFQRWGDWRGERPRRDGRRSYESQQPQQGPYRALQHLRHVKETGAPARVYFGGLGRMINQEEHDKEIRGYLEGFDM